jgi:hypothetical protein
LYLISFYSQRADIFVFQVVNKNTLCYNPVVYNGFTKQSIMEEKMEKQPAPLNKSAKMIATIFGIFAGIGGLTHATGEMIQGNANPGSLYFNSWDRGPVFESMGGDPTISILPNYLFTGIVCLVISLATIAWAAAFMKRKNGGRILLLLSLAMLLFGGGIGPPTIGLLAGATGTWIHSPLDKWRKWLAGKPQQILAALWLWVFGVCLLNGSFLFVFANILISVSGPYNSELFLNSFLIGALTFPAMMLTGIARDITS